MGSKAVVGGPSRFARFNSGRESREKDDFRLLQESSYQISQRNSLCVFLGISSEATGKWGGSSAVPISHNPASELFMALLGFCSYEDGGASGSSENVILWGRYAECCQPLSGPENTPTMGRYAIS